MALQNLRFTAKNMHNISTKRQFLECHLFYLTYKRESTSLVSLISIIVSTFELPTMPTKKKSEFHRPKLTLPNNHKGKNAKTQLPRVALAVFTLPLSRNHFLHYSKPSPSFTRIHQNRLLNVHYSMSRPPSLPTKTKKKSSTR